MRVRKNDTGHASQSCPARLAMRCEGSPKPTALGEERLVSMHLIRLKKPLILEERPTDFFCVFSGSSATLRSLPNAHTEATAERENVLSFSQTGGTTRCLMRAGDLYESTSITYTPGYFESLRKRFPDDFGDAEATMRALGSAGPPAEVRAILRSVTPNGPRCPGQHRISTQKCSKRQPPS